MRRLGAVFVVLAALGSVVGFRQTSAGPAGSKWTLTEPIVTYWGGPDMTDRLAAQLAGGGWNLVWCGEADLETARRHQLRCQLRDPLLTAKTLARADGEQKLREFVRRVRQHPSLLSYYLADEPGTEAFALLRRLVTLIRQEDPSHVAYINLLPIYATNAQLGTRGGAEEAYRIYLRRFVDEVEPDLVSYDHYNLLRDSDRPDYFLNLALVRRQALAAGVPFLNIVQVSGWGSSHRVPRPVEIRFLVYTSLAYGAQGLSYYVYSYRNHAGGAANADGTPTPLFGPISQLNREFFRVARELLPLTSVGAFHMGAQPAGTDPLPANSPFRVRLSTATAAEPHAPGSKGLVIGLFASPATPGAATHALVVNADYGAAERVIVAGPGRLETFSPNDESWATVASQEVELSLGPGDGRLVRVRQPVAAGRR